ncbi:WD G-beta repeat containing protein C2orf44, putative [Babesia ovis]|uniref:WD G-beta repeat containing protein C2orf44, putative n=1 Tax=Babesia ovis TaxID=5869 RepID=A0A9W5WUC3_BABOV|nr:WD G-beta repeat containing protein C2orf44, putative [Babesia ovis]
MAQYGFKAPAMPPEVIAELEKKYNIATPIKEGVVKIPPGEPDVCTVSSPVDPPSQSADNQEKPVDSAEEHPVDKEALIAKIKGSNPNMTPGFRILADSKLCLKVGDVYMTVGAVWYMVVLVLA